MKAVKTTFIGAAYGIGASICLILLGLACDFVSCAWSIITCDCRGSSTDAAGSILRNFGGIFLVCLIGGAVIGLVYGLYKMKEESDEENARIRAEQSEEARKQRKHWASVIKQDALKIDNSCKAIADILRDPIVVRNYKADVMVEKISSELVNVAEIEGKITALVDDVNTMERSYGRRERK